MSRSPDLALLCLAGTRAGARFPLQHWPVTVGRAPDCTIQLEEDVTVSGRHCRLDKRGTEILLTDLQSANGTYLDGRRVYAPEIIRLGAIMSLADVKLGLVEAGSPTTEDSFITRVVNTQTIIVPSTFDIPTADETLVFVDVEESTRYGAQHGEAALLKFLWALACAFERYARDRHVRFMKSTGDGFFATFGEARDAIRTAEGVLKWVSGHLSDAPGLRFAIHYGQVSINADGDRFGLSVHLCARLESVRAADLLDARHAALLPQSDRILLTDAVRRQLNESMRARTTYVGKFLPKGFHEPEDIYVLAR